MAPTWDDPVLLVLVISNHNLLEVSLERLKHNRELVLIENLNCGKSICFSYLKYQ